MSNESVVIPKARATAVVFRDALLARRGKGLGRIGRIRCGLGVNALFLLAAACGRDHAGPTEPPGIETIAEFGKAAVIDVAGATVHVSVIVSRFDSGALVGRAMPRRTVTFSTTAANGSTITASAVTDVDGIATASWKLPTRTGSFSATARCVSCTAVSGSAVVEFIATVLPSLTQRFTLQAPASAAVAAGDLLSIIATVTDQYGNAVSGAIVNLAQTIGGVLVNGRVGGGFSTRTGIDGTVALSVQPTRTGSGNLIFSAAAPTGGTISGTPVTVPVSVAPGAATQLIPQSPSETSATVGGLAPLEELPRLIVADVWNNPVPGVSVTFTTASPGSAIAAGGTPGQSVTVRSNALGIAQIDLWMVGTTPGRVLVRASADRSDGTPLGASPLTFACVVAP